MWFCWENNFWHLLTHHSQIHWQISTFHGTSVLLSIHSHLVQITQGIGKEEPQPGNRAKERNFAGGPCLASTCSSFQLRNGLSLSFYRLFDAITTPAPRHTKSIHFCASSGPSSCGEVWTLWNSQSCGIVETAIGIAMWVVSRVDIDVLCHLSKHNSVFLKMDISHDLMIWRFPESWGYPQSSSIF